MVIMMIFVSLGLLAVLIIFGITNGNYALTILMSITLLIYSCVLTCFRDRIKTGILLVKVATKFMS